MGQNRPILGRFGPPWVYSRSVPRIGLQRPYLSQEGSKYGSKSTYFGSISGHLGPPTAMPVINDNIGLQRSYLSHMGPKMGQNRPILGHI